jgi:plasmid replication initiation protein
MNEHELNNTVTKHNALIEASYRLSLNEIRLILYGISLINPLKSEFPTEIIVDISKFSSLFNTDKNGLYNDLKKSIIRKFWNREFSYKLYNEEIRLSRWLDQVDYCDKRGYIKIYFSERIKPLLCSLSKNFTTFYMNRVVNFKSIHSIRIYEIIIMHLNRAAQDGKCIFSISIYDLKKNLSLEKEYPRFSNFKLKVLEKAKNEINKHSDIRVTYKVEKLGRTPINISFLIARKKTEEDFKKDEVALKIKDAKEKDRRTNHKPMHSTSSNTTTLGSSVVSILKKMEKNID